MAYAIANFEKYRIKDGKTEIIVSVPGESIGQMIADKEIHCAEMRFDDGRTISNEQRRKAYALIDSIAEWTGYQREEVKDIFKFRYYAETGEESLSLKDCSVTDARIFITILMDYCIEEGVQLNEPGVLLADDIGRYLYMCLMNRKCCVCGLQGSDIHHVDAIGAGRNRNKIDDSKMRKMCLCRRHHQIVHQLGQPRFDAMYHVYGIIADKAETTEEDENWG